MTTWLLAKKKQSVCLLVQSTKTDSAVLQGANVKEIETHVRCLHTTILIFYFFTHHYVIRDCVCVLILPICVLILLICVSSYHKRQGNSHARHVTSYYRSILLYICPHTTYIHVLILPIYVSSTYICVLILRPPYSYFFIFLFLFFIFPFMPRSPGISTTS